VNDDFSNRAGVPAGPSAPNEGKSFCRSSRRGDGCGPAGHLRWSSDWAVALWGAFESPSEAVESLVGPGASPFCLHARSLGAPLEAVRFTARRIGLTFEARGFTLRFLSVLR
jgi:hypothetical protein